MEGLPPGYATHSIIIPACWLCGHIYVEGKKLVFAVRMLMQRTCGFLNCLFDLGLCVDHVLTLVLHILHITGMSNHIFVESLEKRRFNPIRTMCYQGEEENSLEQELRLWWEPSEFIANYRNI